MSLQETVSTVVGGQPPGSLRVFGDLSPVPVSGRGSRRGYRFPDITFPKGEFLLSPCTRRPESVVLSYELGDSLYPLFTSQDLHLGKSELSEGYFCCLEGRLVERLGQALVGEALRRHAPGTTVPFFPNRHTRDRLKYSLKRKNNVLLQMDRRGSVVITDVVNNSEREIDGLIGYVHEGCQYAIPIETKGTPVWKNLRFDVDAMLSVCTLLERHVQPDPVTVAYGLVARKEVVRPTSHPENLRDRVARYGSLLEQAGFRFFVLPLSLPETDLERCMTHLRRECARYRELAAPTPIDEQLKVAFRAYSRRVGAFAGTPHPAIV